MFELWWATVLGGIAIGCLGTWLGARIRQHSVITQAEEYAQEILSAVDEKIKHEAAQQKDRWDDLREEELEKFEKDNRRFVQRNDELDEKLKDRESEIQTKLHGIEMHRNRQDQIFRSRQGRLAGRESQVRAVIARKDEVGLKYREGLIQKSVADVAQLKSEVFTHLETETHRQATLKAKAFEAEAELDLEREAKRILQVALSRFPRPYCSERGIGNVDFPNQEVKDRTLGPDRKFLKALEKAVGVDISINEQYQSATILGYDPVRRELGRMVLERMLQDKNLSEARIDQLMQNCKKDLFKKIINDGNRIARELKLEGLSEEIRHMMGALRYRYSFAQNQHFHCAEVGLLCGLLSAEMGVPVFDGRRSGMLHDIGKAMDHSKEGGHAVIGAEFIEQHGEKPHIVHAVRAHHFDEPPATDLAYLVIAADAISGARPGARRSTVDSYTQKIEDLQKISSSFDGVIATYILSAGREVRVVVDSQRIDDNKALELSKQIAKKIEEEASYPGLIKLTVVRETHAIEMAK